MRLRRRLDLSFGAGLVLVLLIGLVSWLGASTFAETVSRTRANAETIDAVHGVLEDVLDIETGMRGYIITGDDEYLEPYKRGATALEADLARLDRRTDSQQLRLLRSQVRAKLDRTAETIRVRRAKGVGAAMERVAEGQGKQTMDEVRRTLAVLEDGLDADLITQLDRDQQRTRLAITFTILGGIAMLMLVIVAAVMVRRAISAPLAALAASASAAGDGDWKHPATIRDDEIGELERALAGMVAKREEAKKRLQELVEDAPEAFFLADLDGKYTNVNGAACQLLGYAREELIGKTIGDLILPEDAPRLAASREVLLTPGAVDVGEWRLRKKTGELVFVEVSAKILPGGRWQAFARDLTARKRLEEERQAAVRAREAMISVVSHDLKNPLNAIELRERVLERRATDPALAEHARTVRRTVATMQRMIRGLLDAASIQAGKLNITRGEHEIADVATSVIEVLSPVAQDCGIELVNKVMPGTKRSFDRDRIEQVLYNLVSNALKFTPEGGSITISVDHRADETIVSVADTGAGIDPEALPKIFDKFFTSGGRSAGTGLGLDIARGLVEAHGGRIWAASTLEVGSTFTFSLPVASPAA